MPSKDKQSIQLKSSASLTDLQAYEVLLPNGDNKTGDLPKDDVSEIMSLVNAARLDTELELNTFEIYWASDEEGSAMNEIWEVEEETRDEFKRAVDSIEALWRQQMSYEYYCTMKETSCVNLFLALVSSELDESLLSFRPRILTLDTQTGLLEGLS